MIASQGRQDHSNRSRVQKRDMKNPNINQSHQMKVLSESHLEKRRKRKQADKFGIPASDDVYYDKEVQQAFDERAPNLQSDESNQNLGFICTKSIKSNKENFSQPGQRSQRYGINTDCDGNEGRYNGASANPDYCIDQAALATEAHTLASTGVYNGAALMPDYCIDPTLATEARTLASTGIYNGAAVMPDYCIDPTLATEARTLASTGIYNGAAVMPDYCIDPALATEAHTLATTGEPADETKYTCIQSRHGIDKCISCNYKRVHESLQEQNHK